MANIPESLATLCMKAHQARSNNTLAQIRNEHLYSSIDEKGALEEYLHDDDDDKLRDVEDSKYETFNDVLDGFDTFSPSCSSQTTKGQLAGELSPTIDANDIQRHFQDMLDMTSFMPILDSEFAVLDLDTEVTSDDHIVNSSTCVDTNPKTSIVNVKGDHLGVISNRPGTSSFLGNITGPCELGNKKPLNGESVQVAQDQTETGHSIRRTRRTRRVRKKKSDNTDTTAADGTSQCQSVTGKEWKAMTKLLDEERDFLTCLQHVASVMVTKWSEYLCMTTKELDTFALREAAEVKMVQEVLDMLQDKDIYVWQLIDELSFF